MYIGTFAVVSMMVGTVVAKGNCDSLYGGNVVATMPPEKLSLLYAYNGTSINDGGGGNDAALTCKVSIATSVAMVAGFYQVTPLF